MNHGNGATAPLVNPCSKEEITLRLNILHNLTMVHNLIELMSRHQPQRVIFLSSVEVYGAPRQLPIDEQTEIRPHTLYGIGKRAAGRTVVTTEKDAVKLVRLSGHLPDVRVLVLTLCFEEGESSLKRAITVLIPRGSGP